MIRYRSGIIQDNLKNAFPEKTDKDLSLIKKAYYRHLSDLLVEGVKLFTIKPQTVNARVEVTNPELIKTYFGAGRSVIGVLGHYGNWELAALRFSQLFEQPRIVVYKPLSNTYADGLVKSMRSRFGAKLVAMNQIGRTLLSFRGKPTMTVLVSDQTPPKPEIQYFTNFLNQPTAVYLGVEKLAKINDSIVVFCDLRRLSRGRYQCTFVPLTETPVDCDPYEITNAHVTYLEKVIREEPQYWLWSHRRWKFKPENT